MGAEMMVLIFVVLGISLAFIIVWIMKSEKVREIYENEVKRMKRRFASKEREISMLADKLEVSERTLSEFEEMKDLGEKEQEIADGVVEDMKNRLKELENENEKIDTELIEARDSLEEVYKVMCDE